MPARVSGPCFVALLALSAIGCDDNDGETPGGGQLRVVQAAPDAGNLDFYVGNAPRPFAKNVAYGQTSLFVLIAPGENQISVRPAGAPLDSAPLFTTSGFVTLQNAEYTLVATGLVSSSDPADSFRVLPIQDDFDSAGDGSARIRVVNAGSDAPPISVDVDGDGIAEAQGIARFTASPPSGFDVPAGSELQVAIDAGSETLTGFTTPRFGAGTTSYWIMTGLVDALPRQPESLSLLSLQTDGRAALTQQNPFVNVFDAVPNTAAFDVFFGAEEVIGELSFGELGVVQLPTGTQTLDFFPAQPGFSLRPTTPPLASATLPDLAAGQEVLAVATGELATTPSTFGLVTVVEQFALDQPEQSLVCAVNAAVDSPSLDVGELQAPGEMAAPPLISGLSFAESSDATGVSLPAADTELGLAETGSTDAEVEFSVQTAPGDRSFLVTAGTFGSSPEGVQVFVVDTTFRPWTATPAPLE